MTEIYPGATNVFTPAFAQGAASDQLVVEFSRKPESFALNRYASLMPVSLSSGYYLRVNTQDAIRVVNTQDYSWPEGGDRPRGKTRQHEFVQYTTHRYAEGFTVGQKTAEQAAWDIIASHARGAAATMMTLRSVNAATLITATSGGLATDTAANVGGGKWDVSTASQLYIRKTVMAVCETIHQATGGVAKPEDLVMVISPTGAKEIATSPEMQAYVVNNESSIPFWQASGVFTTWGLPPKIYGVEVVVEDAVRESARPGVTSSSGYIIDDDAVFLLRPGSQSLPANSATAFSLSTLTGFFYEEMTVEMKEDEWQRRNEGSVVDDYVYAITNASTGYLVQDIYDV